MSYIAWPAAAVLIAVIFCLIFRGPVVRLIDRISRISKGGVEAVALERNAKSQLNSVEPRQLSGAEELLSQFDNALLRDTERAILQDLEQNRVLEAADRERVLVRHLAAVQIAARFEFIYSLIFGSQLKLLQALNSVGTTDLAEVRPYYDYACVQSPDFYADYTFEQWLNFMQSNTLLRVDGGNAVSVTVLGRAFLVFLIQEGRTLLKRS